MRRRAVSQQTNEGTGEVHRHEGRPIALQLEKVENEAGGDFGRPSAQSGRRGPRSHSEGGRGRGGDHGNVVARTMAAIAGLLLLAANAGSCLCWGVGLAVCLSMKYFRPTMDLSSALYSFATCCARCWLPCLGGYVPRRPLGTTDSAHLLHVPRTREGIFDPLLRLLGRHRGCGGGRQRAAPSAVMYCDGLRPRDMIDG